MNKSAADNLVTIYIDDVPCQVTTDNNLLAGVLSNKLNLPYFCWHPAMGSIGACRQCAVTQYQDESDKFGRIVMACMTPVTDGMRISLQDKQSHEFREQVISAMMTNHPHDCPVCAEGGECHLQDMTVMTGHSVRTYQGEKRTYNNQYLGELVGHEMNRCISCYRCLRFYKDFAGGKDFGVFGSSNKVYFGRQCDGELESAFSGNLVEVCPTGVFTNKVFSSHYTRKWDLQSAPSVCNHCSIGCNTSIGSRYNSARRVTNRYNHDINGYFLCDRGRFGIGFTNGSQRISTIRGLTVKNGEPQQGVFSELKLAKRLVKHRQEHFIGIGSDRASFESNRLLKQLLGAENFSLGYSNRQMQLAVWHKQLIAQYSPPNLADIENQHLKHSGEQKPYDLVIIIGELLEQTAPRLALSVRQCLKFAGYDKADEIGVKHWQDSAVQTYAGSALTDLYMLQVQDSSLDELATAVQIQSPEQLILNVKTIADHISQTKQPSDNKLLIEIADKLKQAKRPVIISGTSLQSPALLQALDDLMAKLTRRNVCPNAQLLLVASACNSVGNLSLLNENTLSIEQVTERVKKANASLIVLEQELAGISETQLTALRQACKTLIVLEHSETRLTAQADIVLPTATVAESAGHFVNFQGDLQPFYPAYLPQAPVIASWHWLAILSKLLFEQQALNFTSIQALHQYFAILGEPWATQVQKDQLAQLRQGIAQQTHRASGRTAQQANVDVHESQALKNKANYINFSMEGESPVATGTKPFIWSPRWNSNQAILQHQSYVNSYCHNDCVENRLSFVYDDYIESASRQLWPESIDQLPQQFDQLDEDLVLLQRVPWYLVDPLARIIPEFILRFTGNTIEIAGNLAAHLNFTAQQVIAITITGKTFIAQLIINDSLSQDVVLVSLFQLPFEVNNHLFKQGGIRAATKQEQLDFAKENSERMAQAHAEKAQILTRLKVQDRGIAIKVLDIEEDAKGAGNE